MDEGEGGSLLRTKRVTKGRRRSDAETTRRGKSRDDGRSQEWRIEWKRKDEQRNRFERPKGFQSRLECRGYDDEELDREYVVGR
jgi:hypothetical protein